MDESLVVEKFHGSLDSQRVFRLSGPLTFETLPPLQNALRVETANSVFLDLTDVPYVDSAGLGSLVTASVSCSKTGRQLILSGVQPRVQRVFHITGVDRLFLIFDNIQDALDALTKPANAEQQLSVVSCQLPDDLKPRAQASRNLKIELEILKPLKP
jgi:anti-sigma B factor antagonist